MNLQFKNSDGAVTKGLQERIERKMAKFSRFTDSESQQADAHIDIARAIGSHQSGNVWEATFNIDSNGERYHASGLADTPEKAANKALREVRQELKKAQSKKRSLNRKGGGFFKSLQQRFTRE